MINSVMKSEEGMVLVFDQRGNQIPEYQGKYEDVRERILSDAPPGALFWHVENRRNRAVSREEW